jgi:hypothetical protein
MEVHEFLLCFFKHTGNSPELGARGSELVAALCYKPEGHGIESR